VHKSHKMNHRKNSFPPPVPLVHLVAKFFILDVIRPQAGGDTPRATTPSLSSASVPTDLVPLLVLLVPYVAKFFTPPQAF